MRLLILLGHENDSLGALSKDAKSRCDLAQKIYISDPATYKIFPTGGFGDYFNRSHSPHGSHLKTYLVSLGIDPAAILPPTLSLGTLEDAWHVLRYIYQSNFDGKIDVVTSEFHLQRVCSIFKRVLPRFDLTFHAAQNCKSGRSLARQLKHERKSKNATLTNWVDVASFDLSLSPDVAMKNLGEEIRHYDNLSLACITAAVISFGFILSKPILLPEGLSVRWSYVGCLFFVILMHYLYLRFANTASSARRVLSATECLYLTPGLSHTHSKTTMFGFQIGAKAVISLLTVCLLAALCLLVLKT